MSAEDRLREILSSEASTVLPAGDGLTRIQERVARRRRLRMVLLPAGALATAGVVAAVLALGGGVGSQSLEQTPATQGPTPSPTTASGYDGPAIWPFGSQADVDSWNRDPGSRGWAANAREVAQRFATDFLQLPGVTAVGDGREVSLRLGTVKLGTARLERLEADGPWTVVAVDGGDLIVTTPAAGARISSPTSVEGRIDGLHENVRLQLVTTAGKQLTQASAPAGQEAPWQGTLTWTDSTWSTGGIVGTTRSDRDGSLTRLVAVPVTRSSDAPFAPDSFVGLVDGKVLLLDGTNGRRLSQLTYPPAGTTDTSATWSNDRLAWVRSAQTGCDNTLFLKAGEGIETIVPGRGFIIQSPQLSPSGAVLAWVQQPCEGGVPVVRVRAEGAPIRDVVIESNLATWVRDVRNDGALLVVTKDPERTDPAILRVVPGDATRLSSGRVMTGAPGCEWRAAAFLGSSVLGGETCGDRSRAIPLSDDGSRRGADTFLPAPQYFGTITVRESVVLVQIFSSDVDSRGIVGRYSRGVVSPFDPLPSCSAETGAGCLLAPDW